MEGKEHNVIVGVGDICFSTNNGNDHILMAGGTEVVLSTLDVGCLKTAVDSYERAIHE